MDLILLNTWKGTKIPKDEKDLITILLVAAKAIFVAKWKDLNVPSNSQWYTRVWDSL